MTAVAKKAPLSKKQVAADKSNAAKGRASQAKAKTAYEKSHHGRKPPRSKKQVAAARQNIARARAAQKARRQGKKFVSSVKPKAALGLQVQVPLEVPGGDPSKTAFSLYLPDLVTLPGYEEVVAHADDLHFNPVCAITAVAGSLAWSRPDLSGDVRVRPEDVLDLNERLGDVTMEELFEEIRFSGFAGGTLARSIRCEQAYPGAVCVLELPGAGWHAGLAVPGGLLSWGMILPWRYEPAQCWLLDWEVT